MLIRVHAKHVNITVTQVCASTTYTEEETESFCASVQEEIEHTPKQDVLVIIGICNKKSRK